VTYEYYPGKPVQMQSYNYAIQRFRSETKWLAIIDGDEYLLPMEDGKNLVETLEQIKNNFINHKMRIATNVGAVGVNWRCYGTSNHKERQDGLCISDKGATIPFKYFYDSQCTKIRINHYFSKSEDEFRNKIEKRGWPDGEHDRNVENEMYEATVNCNKVYDDVMKKYVDKVKKIVRPERSST
jgi:hypothetical protein